MKHTWYTYKDFVTAKIRKTRGVFSGFTKPTGLLQTRYAIFELSASTNLVPEYLLTKETKQAIEDDQPYTAEEAVKVLRNKLTS